MKQVSFKLMIAVVLLAMIGTSCNKGGDNLTSALAGKWKASEYYVKGPNMAPPIWQPVNLDAHYQFQSLQFIKTYSSAGIVYTECHGKYSLSSDKTLRIKTNCSDVPILLQLMEVTSDRLIVAQKSLTDYGPAETTIVTKWVRE